jgi:hypothetical protein
MKYFKPSRKHIQIFKTIQNKGYYKPTYSDQEPATKTLINLGIVQWREDWRGVILTDFGKEAIKNYKQ